MRRPLILLAFVAMNVAQFWATVAYGAADQIQTCSSLTGPAPTLVGCPTKNVSWGPATTDTLVRTQVNGAQTWVPYKQLTAASQVVIKSTGGWAPFSSVTITPAPTTGGGGSVTPPPPPYSQSLTVNWAAPTANTDGSSLTDLVSYNIYMGATAANLLPVGKVMAPATIFTTAPLTVGDYVFAVTAVNSSGNESARSGVVNATVKKPTSTPNAPTGVQVK